ncbi:Uncharacterized protein Adt_38608 [Abeliophyllum distichum]|uniref:Uncharacterized protein n=1 Tax=Abeliophyllum distichum TaxID=126358 RepID=A0ABD1Q2R3_9LAMI
MLGLGLNLICEEDFDLLGLVMDLLQFEEDFDLLEISWVLDFLQGCGFSPGLASGLLAFLLQEFSLVFSLGLNVRILEDLKIEARNVSFKIFPEDSSFQDGGFRGLGNRGSKRLDFRGPGNRGSECIFLDIFRRLTLPGLGFREPGNKGSEHIFLDILRRLTLPGMAQSNSKSRENMKLPEITQLNDTARKGKVFCFPKTIVKYHSQTNATGELKLTIHMPMPCPSTLCVPLKELHMHILSNCQRNFDAFQHPSLGPPPHHSQDMKIIPRTVIFERINQREIKWRSALSSLGEASYLSKFWEWSVWIHKLLVKRNLSELASAIYSATKDYSRPNSVYRALCNVWCSDTNTFITTNGEIDDGGPKRLKFTFPSTRNVPSLERVEKIPGTILVSEDSNSGDQASRGLEATLVLKDSSSEDQRSIRLKKSQAIESNHEVCAETFKMDLSIPAISSDDENLDMSPQTWNAGFSKIPEELNFYTSPSPLLDENNENLDIIDALDGIDGLNGSKDLSCDSPSHISGGILASKLADINDEGEVNYGTSVVKIPENEQEAPVTPSSLSLIVVPTSNINNRGIAPICSSISGLPLGITEDFSLLKDVFRAAMTKYLKKSFTNVINHGFSNLRTWWAKSNQRLQNLITESFQADLARLTRRMEVFLKRVDSYLSKRKQILECPTLGERDHQLKSLNSRIYVEMAIFSSLENKIGQLAFELDKLRDELQTHKENLDKMEDARITLEQAQVRNITNVESIDQERKTLEYNLLQLVESD